MANQRNQDGSVTRGGVTMTPREMDVLRAIESGLATNNKIASKVKAQPQRVNQLKASIRRRFGLHVEAGHDEIIARARELGFVE